MRPWLALALIAALASFDPAQALTRPGAARAAHCCLAPAGAAVEVELIDPVSTRLYRTGDRVLLRLAAPLIVDGRVLLHAGTPGEGEVIESSRPGFGGKAAKLVLAADFLRLGDRRIPLRGLQLAAAGKGNVMPAEVIGLSGIVLGPIGFVGMAVQGDNVEFPAGTKATAELAASVVLPSLGRATSDERALAGVMARPAPVSDGVLVIAPPPKGMGQVVFFRAHSLLGTGQWFNVRENGKALGKLTNGAYFVETVEPGLHTYTATEEPEFKDSLKLQIDPDHTYFVEGILTKGVVIGAADLTPSDRAAFDKAAGGLKQTETAQP